MGGLVRCYRLISCKNLQLLVDQVLDGVFDGGGQATAVSVLLFILRVTASGQPAALAATNKTGVSKLGLSIGITLLSLKHPAELADSTIKTIQQTLPKVRVVQAFVGPEQCCTTLQHIGLSKRISRLTADSSFAVPTEHPRK